MLSCTNHNDTYNCDCVCVCVCNPVEEQLRTCVSLQQENLWKAEQTLYSQDLGQRHIQMWLNLNKKKNQIHNPMFPLSPWQLFWSIQQQRIPKTSTKLTIVDKEGEGYSRGGSRGGEGRKTRVWRGRKKIKEKKCRRCIERKKKKKMGWGRARTMDLEKDGGRRRGEIQLYR